MKKIIAIFIVVSLLFPCISCARDDKITLDDPNISEPSQSDTDSGTEDEKESPKSFAKERKISIKSGANTLKAECLFHNNELKHSYREPNPDYCVFLITPSREIAFFHGSASMLNTLPTLYRNGEIIIETSEDCGKIHIDVASFAEDPYAASEFEWKSITLQELNALKSGTWYINVSVTWFGDYYPEDEDYEKAVCDYGFALIVDQEYDRDHFLESQTDIFQFGEMTHYIDSYGVSDDRYKEYYQDELESYAAGRNQDPEKLIQFEQFRENSFGLYIDLVLKYAEFYRFLYDQNTHDSSEKILLYRYSITEVTLGISKGAEYDLTVLHESEDTALTEEQQKVFETNHEILTEHEGEDLRFCQADGIVDYYRDGIRYTYANGELSEIYWESGDTKFWIDFLPAYFSLTEADWENISSPILKCFLNKDQTATAIAWFDELITVDEGQ